MTEFTPIQQRILEVLSDGHAHTRDEVLRCLDDDTASYSNLHPHITTIRKKLIRQGQHISCELRGRSIFYRHVRLISTE